MSSAAELKWMFFGEQAAMCFFAVLPAQKLQRNLSMRLHNLKRKMCNFYLFCFSPRPSPFILSPSTSDGLQETCHVAHACRLLLCGRIPTSGPRKKINNTLSGGEKKRKTVKHDSALTAAESAHFQAVNLGVRHFSDKGGTERKYCAGRERKRRTTRLQPCGVA